MVLVGLDRGLSKGSVNGQIPAYFLSNGKYVSYGRIGPRQQLGWLQNRSCGSAQNSGPESYWRRRKPSDNPGIRSNGVRSRFRLKAKVCALSTNKSDG